VPNGCGGTLDCGVCDAGTDAAPTCNAIPLPTTDIAARIVTTPAPTPSGGTFTPGVYQLIDVTIYTASGSTPPVYPITRGAMLLFPGFIQLALMASGAPLRANFNFAMVGNTLALTSTCPAGGTSSMPFTSDGDVFSMFSQSSEGLTVVQTFRRTS
jgi:hypothetical protein